MAQPPIADREAACDVNLTTVAKFHSKHQKPLVIITVDHVHKDSTLQFFRQIVDCITWEIITMELLYANVSLHKNCKKVDFGGQCGPAGLL